MKVHYQETLLIRRIPLTSSGAVFIPQSKYNVKSDVVGIFKTSTLDYVVLCVQANDWFTDIIRDGRVRQ